jgi:endonuclease/exonuclease/phosphatase family metal-dependent hydrolase
MSLSEIARRRNVVEIWDFVSKYNGNNIPQILVGDFNSEPNSSSLDFLVGKIELSATTGDFKDAWQILHLNNQNDWTFTTLADQPKKRIDFILFRGNIDIQDIYIIKNNENEVPSDHRGLVANFVTKFQK